MPPALPHPNTYGVPGSRLIAGEYPFTEHPDSARLKLQSFVRSGITCFVDLTEEGELRAYEAALREIAGAGRRRVYYRRLPIRDMDIPNRLRMSSILDTIDSVEAEGGIPYVHCWGGVGRTGTVVGCYLVRRGMSPDAALQQVAALFATMSPDKGPAAPGRFAPDTAAAKVCLGLARSARRRTDCGAGATTCLTPDREHALRFHAPSCKLRPQYD